MYAWLATLSRSVAVVVFYHVLKAIDAIWVALQVCKILPQSLVELDFDNVKLGLSRWAVRPVAYQLLLHGTAVLINSPAHQSQPFGGMICPALGISTSISSAPACLRLSSAVSNTS